MLNSILARSSSTRSSIIFRLQAVKLSIPTRNSTSTTIDSAHPMVPAYSLPEIVSESQSDQKQTSSSPSYYSSPSTQLCSTPLSARCIFSPIENPFADEAYPSATSPVPSLMIASLASTLDIKDREASLRAAFVPRIKTQSLTCCTSWAESIVLPELQDASAAFKRPKQLRLGRDLIGWFDRPGTCYRIHAGLDFEDDGELFRSDRYQDHQTCGFEEFRRPGIYESWDDVQSS